MVYQIPYVTGYRNKYGWDSMPGAMSYSPLLLWKTGVWPRHVLPWSLERGDRVRSGSARSAAGPPQMHYQSRSPSRISHKAGLTCSVKVISSYHGCCGSAAVRSSGKREDSAARSPPLYRPGCRLHKNLASVGPVLLSGARVHSPDHGSFARQVRYRP